MQHKVPHVLVFDSGVGGLSIVAEIRRALPALKISYASDNGFFPYGTKSEVELVARVEQVLLALVEKCHPTLVVVACNTASTVALPSIRERFAIPIVGVVPAIKPAAQLSTSKVIGLLATPGTVSRPYTHQLILDFAADCHVLPLGSSRLVELAEDKLRGRPIEPATVEEALRPLVESEYFPQLDTLVLACTHFPLIRDELASVLNKDVSWVDSGEAIARRVRDLLLEAGMDPDHTPVPTCNQSYFTRAGPEVEELLPYLQKALPGPVEIITLLGAVATA